MSWAKGVSWPADVEALKPGDKCMYRYPARNVWRPASVVHNGGPGFWRVHNAEVGEVGGLYIEFIRVPGDPEAHPEAPAAECEHAHTRPDPDSDEWLCDDCGQRIFSP